ncbi:high-temperature-induced dauer-formation protein-domain-containing protein [Mrakia frigida]|uniref:high-temperature-induced dauer-formation protein-domain-containing protein n=1 Tax=Mrakia frigida TaxID=29902 RepID=UPI003FCC20BC
MFSSVSKAGASALGLLYNSAEDAKLAFRTKQGGVKRLQGGEAISPNDVAYWSQFYMLFDSASEVYSLITLEDIRQTLILNPVNLQSLITFLSNHLFSLLSSPLFPSPISTSTLTSLLPSRSNSHSSSSSDPTAEALNCLRVLGRILPVLYEAEGLEGSNLGDEEGRRFVQEVLWTKNEAMEEEREEGGELDDEGQFVIDDDEDEEKEDGLGTAEQPSTPGGEKTRQRKVVEVPSLAERLFHTVVDLMFTEGFTLPPGVGGAGGDKVNYCIWERGVGSTVNVGSTAQLDENKVEVLRFFLILLSTPIYTPPPLLPSLPSLPLLLLTHKTERRLVLSLLCSFLNTALNPNPVALLGVLPYSHLLAPGGKGIGGFGGGNAGGKEGREGLRKKALQGLLSGLDYWCEEGTGVQAFGENGEEEVTSKKGNAFRFFVSKLHRKDDLAFILDGILAILAQHLEVANGLLPGSTRAPPMLLEIFMLLWRLIDLNKKFRAYILADEKRTIDVMTYTIFTSLQLKDNLAHHGLLRMCAYILQTLSADPAFGIAITSSPVSLSLPAKYVVPGTAADFLITSIYSITTTSGLNSLFPALTITVTNVAPYLKDLGVQASTRLIQLFSAFSSPAFLLKDEAHPRLVNYMLETFNSVIFHQLSNNPNLVYAILGAHQRFQFLATFTLKAGLREVLRVQQARAVAAEKAKRSESRNGADPGTPTDEKSGLIYRTDSSDNASRQTLDLSREYSSPPPSNPTSNPRPNSTTNLDSTTEEDEEEPRETVAPLMTPGEQQQDPLTSVTSPTAPTTATPVPVMSEKARGKMRERNVEEVPEEGGGENGGGGEEVDDGLLGEELEKLRIGGLGNGGFVPSQEWVTSWQKGLPLDPILLFISELLPKVESLQTSKTQGPNKEIIKFLRSVTLLDVLPPAPPVLARKFLFSQTSQIWLTSLLWGEIYVSGMSPLGLWTGTSVKLFGVKAAPPGRRDIALKNVQSTLTSVFRSSNSNGNVSSSGERRPSAPARHSSSYSLSSRRSSVGGGGAI